VGQKWQMTLKTAIYPPTTTRRS